VTKGRLTLLAGFFSRPRWEPVCRLLTTLSIEQGVERLIETCRIRGWDECFTCRIVG